VSGGGEESEPTPLLSCRPHISGALTTDRPRPRAGANMLSTLESLRLEGRTPEVYRGELVRIVSARTGWQESMVKTMTTGALEEMVKRLEPAAHNPLAQ